MQIFRSSDIQITRCNAKAIPHQPETVQKTYTNLSKSTPRLFPKSFQNRSGKLADRAKCRENRSQIVSDRLQIAPGALGPILGDSELFGDAPGTLWTRLCALPGHSRDALGGSLGTLGRSWDVSGGFGALVSARRFEAAFSRRVRNDFRVIFGWFPGAPTSTSLHRRSVS